MSIQIAEMNVARQNCPPFTFCAAFKLGGGRGLKQIEFYRRDDSIGKDGNGISLEVVFNGEEEPRP